MWFDTGMAARSTTLHVDGIDVTVVRKRIKHTYLSVSRVNGAVRVSAPLRADDRAVRELVASKLAWIRRKRHESEQRPRLPPPRFQSGESHPVWGRTLELVVREERGRPDVRRDGDGRLALRVPPEAPLEARSGLLDAWYRAELASRVPTLVAKWEPVVGETVAEWRIKKMKTRWGSCNHVARRIWLSLELAKKPPACLEYVLVHEMAHLIEPNHSKRFYAVMDRLMPDWKTHRDVLDGRNRSRRGC